MRHTLKILTSSGLLLGASVVGCTIVQKSDDSGAGGASVSLGGSNVAFSGGASSTGKGGASSSSTGGSSTSTAGSSATECASLVGLDEGCGTSSVKADERIVNMMLVIDKSASMTDTPMGFTQTKWDALKSALQTALKNVQDQINFGMIQYPYPVDPAAKLNDFVAQCHVETGAAAVNVPIGSGVAAVSAVAGALNATSPSGGTPTAAALRAAYDYFTSGDGMMLQGGKFVLLATDGGPNCDQTNSCATDATLCTSNLDGNCSSANCCTKTPALCLDDQHVTQEIQLLKAAGIPTFVVGIPGTEAYANYLDQFAEAGGKPDPAGTRKFYEVKASGGVQGLVDVFNTITTQLVKSCDIQLPMNPDDVDKVNVAIDCTAIPQSDMTWVIDQSTNPYTLNLKGATCDKVQSIGAKRVDVVFGCPVLR